MRVAARALLGGGVLLGGLGAAGLGLDAAGDGDGGRIARGAVTVELGIHHSRFSFGELTVRRGTEVRFVVVNDDPINHELIVGDDDVHRRHEAGIEPQHAPRPGEVSVGPNARAETSYVFGEAGTFVFACHLPGHVAYGMEGVIEVVD